MFRRISLDRCLPGSLFPLALVLLAASPSPGQDKKPAARQYMEVDLGGGITMKMVRIEPGKFMMGSPKYEQDYIRQQYDGWGDLVAREEKQHEVEITKAFYMGVYTVTQAEYEKLMGKNPSIFSRDGGLKQQVAGLDTARFPVEQVSWGDAMAFCRKLSQLEGKTFDLPTEAEWEYACRAGSSAAFQSNSLSSKQANVVGSKPYGEAEKGPELGRTTRVGSYEPNAFGLYDMHGNVYQWCKDWFKLDYSGESPRRDPQGPATGNFRVLRGGCFDNDAMHCRSACRVMNLDPDVRYGTIGFRVVVRLP